MAALPSTRAAAPSSKFSAAAWLGWFYILLAIGRLSELVPVLGKLPLSKIVALVWACAVLSRRSLATSLPDWSLPTMRLGLALLALAWASLLFSIWTSASFAFMTSGGIVVPVSVVLLLFTMSDWATVKGTILCLIVTGALFSVIAIAGYGGGGRLSVGYSFDPNDLAYLLVTVLPLSIAFTLSSKGMLRLIYLGVTGAMAITALLTQSRGAFVALLVMMVLLVFKPLRMPVADDQPPARTPAQRLARKKPGNAGLFTRLIVLGACAGVCWMLMPGEAKSRLLSTFEVKQDYNMDASNHLGRTSVWKRNMAALAQRPIGFGVAASPMADARSGGHYIQMHNSVVQMAVELGYLGMLLFLAVYWMAWRWTGKCAREGASTNPEAALFCSALRLSVVANFIAGFFLSQAYSNLFWVLVTVCTATAIVLKVPYSTPKLTRAQSMRLNAPRA